MEKIKISTVEELAKIIGCDVNEMMVISDNLRPHYYFFEHENNGKKRTFTAPLGKFLTIQRKLNKNLLQRINLPNIIKGGVAGCSIKKNAEIHTGQDVVVATDIKDYFPSISSGRIEKLFLSLGASEIVAEVLTNLTTCNGRMPLGFPTSVTIANLVACSMAKRFIGLCRKYNFNCSIWVDDIVFSGSFKLMGFVQLIKRIIYESGFQVKEEKTKVMKKHDRQIVTKLTVNSKVNISKTKKRELRSLIYRCKKYGPGTQTDLDLDTFRKSLAGKISSVSYINKNTGNRLISVYNQIVWQ